MPKNATRARWMLGIDRTPGGSHGAERLGIAVTQGREIEALADRVWAIPFWRLFGPAR